MESEENKKSLLILIHPDCAYELGADQSKKYSETLKEHSIKFDYIITHAFTSNINWIDSSYIDQNEKLAFKELYETVKNISNIFAYNSKDAYGCTYQKELPDYLIDNPNTNIYMAGGYDTNCLWISYKMLFDKLKWLLDENSTKVTYYKPLIFATSNNGGITPNPNRYFHEQPPFKPWQKTYGDFHPDKVDYTEF